MSEPIVSVIMPVYGVEDYVGRAIESLQAQTLQNWKLYAVDDGTKDRSGIICDEYAAKDSRITVIHKENGGAPSARNVAIALVDTKYMYFMDSDDWAEPTMLKDLVSIAENYDSQLVISGFYIDTYYTDTDKFVQEKYVSSTLYRNQKEFREDTVRVFDQNLLYTPWNKLFLSEYILSNGIKFPHTFWDDFPFVLSVIRDIERVTITNKCYYHFIRQRAESETAKYRPDMYDKREEEDAWMVDLYNHWNMSTPEIDEFLARRYIERLIGCVENVTNRNCTLNTKEKLKSINKMINSPRAKETVRMAKPNSSYMKIMLIPIKLRLSVLTYLEGTVISIVKSNNTELFAKLKAYR